MKKESLIIVGIAIAAVAILVFNFVGNRQVPSGAGKKIVDEGFFLPGGDEAPRYRQEDLDIVFLGDIAFGSKAEGTDAEKLVKDYLGDITSVTQASDVVVGGLATSLRSGAAEGKPVRSSNLDVTVATLKAANITAVSLANPHSNGYGSEALQRASSGLESAGIEWFGASAQKGEPARDLKIERRLGEYTIRIAVIGVSERVAHPIEDEAAEPAEPADADAVTVGEEGDTPSRLYPATMDADDVSRRIGELKAAQPDTLVVVFPSWGRLGEWKNRRQIKTARGWIDDGADYVIGYGAGTMQQVQKYESGWTLFGLGNGSVGLNGEGSSQDDQEPLSMMARLTFSQFGGKLSRRMRVYPLSTAASGDDPSTRFVDPSDLNRAYWNLIVKEWTKTDRWLKRQVWVGRDKFGRYLQLGLDGEDKEVK